LLKVVAGNKPSPGAAASGQELGTHLAPS